MPSTRQSLRAKKLVRFALEPLKMNCARSRVRRVVAVHLADIRNAFFIANQKRHALDQLRGIFRNHSRVVFQQPIHPLPAAHAIVIGRRWPRQSIRHEHVSKLFRNRSLRRAMSERIRRKRILRESAHVRCARQSPAPASAVKVRSAKILGNVTMPVPAAGVSPVSGHRALRNANTPRSGDEIPNQSKAVAAATVPAVGLPAAPCAVQHRKCRSTAAATFFGASELVSFQHGATLFFGGVPLNPYKRRLITVRVVVLLLVGLAFLIARIARG